MTSLLQALPAKKKDARSITRQDRQQGEAVKDDCLGWDLSGESLEGGKDRQRPNEAASDKPHGLGSSSLKSVSK